MPIIDHTNNNIQQELRDTSLAVWDLKPNTYAKGIIPSKSSQLSSGTYWEYEKEYFMSTQVAARAAGSVPPVAKYGAKTANYSISSKHLGVAITNEEIVEASDILSPIMDASTFLGNNFLVDYELDFANSFLVDNAWEFQSVGQAGATTDYLEGNVTANIGAAGASVFQQFDQATSDPLNILLQAVRSIQLTTGIRPNKLLIPRPVMDALRDNDNVNQWAANTLSINGGESQVKSILAQHLEIPEAGIQIVEMVFQDIASIALANRDTQNHNFGQTSTPTFATDGTLGTGMKWMIEKSVLLMYNEPAFSKYAKTAAACFKWDGLTDSLLGSDPALASEGGIDTPNLMFRSRYDSNNFTHYVEGYFAYENKIVSPNLGFFLKDAIA